MCRRVWVSDRNKMDDGDPQRPGMDDDDDDASGKPRLEAAPLPAGGAGWPAPPTSKARDVGSASPWPPSGTAKRVGDDGAATRTASLVSGGGKHHMFHWHLGEDTHK